MSCKLSGKSTIVSVNFNFLTKMSILWKNIEILREMLTLSFCKICLFFLVKCDVLCEGLYTLTKCQILIKNFNFLGYINLHMY